MHRQFRNPIPGDATDPESLTALLEQYLLWMETHHYAQERPPSGGSRSRSSSAGATNGPSLRPAK